MERFDTLQHSNDDPDAQHDAFGSLVVFILDTNPSSWAVLEAPTLRQSLADILIFLNAHLALNQLNQAAVIASHIDSAKFLYPSPSTSTAATQFHERNVTREANAYRPFLTLQDQVTQNLSAVLSSTTQASIAKSRASMMSGAITLALSFINKATTTASALTGGHDQSSSGTNNARNNVTTPALRSRIMILSVSGDLAFQYIPMMNCIFSAQRQKVTIDICRVGGDGDAVFLQQASDATRGIYKHIAPGESVLTYLMMLFLPDQETRKDLNLPTAANVDFRAACFCHKRVVDVGFVCSVCLSIFCQALPKCITCDSVFDMQEMKAFGAKPAVLVKKTKRKGQQSLATLQHENSITID